MIQVDSREELAVNKEAKKERNARQRRQQYGANKVANELLQQMGRLLFDIEGINVKLKSKPLIARFSRTNYEPSAQIIGRFRLLFKRSFCSFAYVPNF